MLTYRGSLGIYSVNIVTHFCALTCMTGGPPRAIWEDRKEFRPLKVYHRASGETTRKVNCIYICCTEFYIQCSVLLVKYIGTISILSQNLPNIR